MGFIRGAFLISLLFFTTSCAFSRKADLQPKISNSAAVNFEKLQAKELRRIDRQIAKLRREELKSDIQQPSYKLPKPLSEDTLYAEVITSYRSSDLQKLLFFQKTLAQRFPKSIHLDNALFLSGKLLFKNKLLARSLSYFHRITEQLLSSNKRPAALLMKARVYSRLNLPEVALATLQQLRKEYPGSPEYYQAEGEIQLIERTMASG